MEARVSDLIELRLKISAVEFPRHVQKVFKPGRPLIASTVLVGCA